MVVPASPLLTISTARADCKAGPPWRGFEVKATTVYTISADPAKIIYWPWWLGVDVIALGVDVFIILPSISMLAPPLICGGDFFLNRIINRLLYRVFNHLLDIGLELPVHSTDEPYRDLITLAMSTTAECWPCTHCVMFKCVGHICSCEVRLDEIGKMLIIEISDVLDSGLLLRSPRHRFLEKTSHNAGIHSIASICDSWGVLECSQSIHW